MPHEKDTGTCNKQYLNTYSCVVVVARAGETDPNECARSLGGVQPADEARGRNLGRMII